MGLEHVSKRVITIAEESLKVLIEFGRVLKTFEKSLKCVFESFS